MAKQVIKILAKDIFIFFKFKFDFKPQQNKSNNE